MKHPENYPEIHPRWQHLANLRMAEKLTTHEAIDLSACRRTDDGDYILDGFIDGADYCDSKTEQWIWSIGRNRKTGEVRASITSKFYTMDQDPVWECLWLR